MSHKELNRLEVLQRVVDRRITQRKAAEMLGIGERQVRRLLEQLAAEGAAGLRSRRRGAPGNRRHTPAKRRKALALVRRHYSDFGPTLANEKLREVHGITISTETLRAWMVAAEMWVPRSARRRVYQPRNRRECLGELIQIDGSPHAWFEDRGPVCSLLVFVDDATSRLMELRFVPTETAFDYFEATKSYIHQHGKPVCFYSDKHAIFRVSKKSHKGEDALSKTQFGRALDALNIDIICANTPQAKGRVERANRTLQDRLVKELRLAGISTMTDGNTFAKHFMDDFNARFAKPPKNPHDAHRPLLAGEDLHDTMALREARKITGDLMVHYKHKLYRILPSPEAMKMARKTCEVVEWIDGTVEIRCDGITLPYVLFDKNWTAERTPIVENKHLDAAMRWAKEKQKERLAQGKLPARATKREKERITAKVSG